MSVEITTLRNLFADSEYIEAFNYLVEMATDERGSAFPAIALNLELVKIQNEEILGTKEDVLNLFKNEFSEFLELEGAPQTAAMIKSSLEKVEKKLPIWALAIPVGLFFLLLPRK